MSLQEIMAILMAHFCGDWLLQWPWISRYKSERFEVLLLHCTFVCLCFCATWPSMNLPIGMFVNWLWACVFLHGLQDWFIWRIANRISAHLWPGVPIKETWFFWKVIGVDQFLHYAVYFTVYSWVI